MNMETVWTKQYLPVWWKQNILRDTKVEQNIPGTPNGERYQRKNKGFKPERKTANSVDSQFSQLTSHKLVKLTREL